MTIRHTEQLNNIFHTHIQGVTKTQEHSPSQDKRTVPNIVKRILSKIFMVYGNIQVSEVIEINSKANQITI